MSRIYAFLVFEHEASAHAGEDPEYLACAGDVALVPLDALPTRGGRVGDDVEISVITSLLDLLPSPSRPARRPLLAVGGVDYDAASDSRPASRPGAVVPRDARVGSLAPLPGAAAEVAAVVSVIGDPDGALLLTGADATKARFLAEAPTARVLHVATHGLFAPDSVALVGRTPGLGGDPTEFSGARDLVVGFAPFLLAGLAFAGANRADAAQGRDDGLLTAAELAAVDLSACELATLSACESAAGRRRRSGDLTSLRQALHAAGVRHALTSLWKVPDAATRDLMVEFHRRRTRLGEEPHRALREAKRLLREARDPATGAPLRSFRDWAGWVLTGAPAP